MDSRWGWASVREEDRETKRKRRLRPQRREESQNRSIVLDCRIWMSVEALAGRGVVFSPAEFSPSLSSFPVSLTTPEQAGLHTALAVANFFSVPMMAPLRWAALSALFPLTTVSRGPAAAPRVRDPILVTVSHSSLIVSVCIR